MSLLLQTVTDFLDSAQNGCEKLPYVDKDRLGCIGDSFGGFSVYYLAGHHNKRFKAFISHDGAFNLESMYTDTEEAWFSNWEYEDAYWNKDLSLNAIDLLTNGILLSFAYKVRRIIASIPTKVWEHSTPQNFTVCLLSSSSSLTRTTGFSNHKMVFYGNVHSSHG